MKLAGDGIKPDLVITSRNQQHDEGDSERWPSLQPGDSAGGKQDSRQGLDGQRDRAGDQWGLLERNEMERQQGCRAGRNVEIAGVNREQRVEPRPIPGLVEIDHALLGPEPATNEDCRNAYDHQDDEQTDEK